MRPGSAERGNTLLIVTVLILGMTMLSLGVMRFVQRHARDSANMKFAGYPATQALYAAEMGINALLYDSNSAALLPAAPVVNSPFQTTRTVTYPGAAPVTLAYGYQIAPQGVFGGRHRFEVTGEAWPVGGTTGWDRTRRRIVVELASSGTMWTLERYERQ